MILQKRYHYIDVAKLMGLYLMILCHQTLVSSNISSFVYSFHMPLFFLVSGVFHKEREFYVNIKQIWRSLIVPYLLIALSFCLLYLVLRWRKDVLSDSYWDFAIGTFISPGKSYHSLSTFCIYIWFLLVLAEIKIISAFTESKGILCTMTIGSVFAFYVLHVKWGGVMPFQVDSALMAFPFYVIGFLLKGVVLREGENRNKLTMILSLIVMFCLLLLLTKWNGICDINSCEYGESLLLYYFNGVLGSLLVIKLAKLFVLPKTFLPIISVYMSGATLIIGYSAYSTGEIKRLLPVLCNNNLGGVLIAAIVLAVLYPIILIASKYFPAILGKRNVC